MRFNRSNKFSLLVLLLTLLMTLDTSRASACSCVVNQRLIDRITDASAIFSGKVTQISLADASPVPLLPGIPVPELKVPRANIEVSQVWKEWADQPFSVTTAIDSGICPYSFQVDTEYLIYAYEYNEQLYVSMCSNTKPLKEAGSEIAILNNLFSPMTLDRLSPDATVTVTGYGLTSAPADQIEMHLVIDEEWQHETPVEEIRDQIIDWLTAHGAEEILAAGWYHIDQDGFYITVQQNNFPTGNLGAVLALLNNIEHARQQEDGVNIERMEVRYSVQDCTQVAIRARFSALYNARQRAELLAIQAGGRRGALVAIVETSAPPAPGEAIGWCYETPTQWLALPLESDFDTQQQIIWQASLSVTYEVDEIGVSESPTTLPAPTPSSAQTSPIPTPTAQ